MAMKNIVIMKLKESARSIVPIALFVVLMLIEKKEKLLATTNIEKECNDEQSEDK